MFMTKAEMNSGNITAAEAMAAFRTTEALCENERRIAEVIEDIMSLKDEPESKEIRENCIMINFIANQMQGEKPYYTILYYDKRDNNYHEGFGSYNHHIVNAYKEVYFDHWDENFFVKQIEGKEE